MQAVTRVHQGDGRGDLDRADRSGVDEPVRLQGLHHYDLRPGGRVPSRPERRSSEPSAEAAGFPCPDMLVDGEVIEAEAPHKLVTTWRMLMDPTTAAEPMTTITYEIAQFDGYCSLTVAHDVTDAPVTGGHGPRRRRGRSRWWRRRARLDPQRSQVAARDRFRPRRLIRRTLPAMSMSGTGAGTSTSQGRSGLGGDLLADDVQRRAGLEPLDLLGAERVHAPRSRSSSRRA